MLIINWGLDFQVYISETRFPTLTSLVDPENVWQEMCGQIVQPRMVLLWGKSSKLHISPETWLLKFNFDNPNPLVWIKVSVQYMFNFLFMIAIGLIKPSPSACS